MTAVFEERDRQTAYPYETSNPCNVRCIHCCRTGDETRCGFLLLAQAQSAIEQVHHLGATDATIMGGEALLNPTPRYKKDAARMVRYAMLLTKGSGTYPN